MSEESANQTSHQLTAKEISERFINLISNMKSQDDLSLEGVQNSTGITLHESANKKYYGFSQKLEDGWFYVLWYYPNANGKKKGIRLDFEHETERFSDMNAVCSIDFNGFHNALTKMGYRSVSTNSEIGLPQEWRYYKDDIAIVIIPEFKANPKDGSLFPSCVKTIGTLN